MLTCYHYLKPVFYSDFLSFYLRSFFCSRIPPRTHITLSFQSSSAPQGWQFCEDWSGTLVHSLSWNVMLFSGLDWRVRLGEEAHRRKVSLSLGVSRPGWGGADQVSPCHASSPFPRLREEVTMCSQPLKEGRTCMLSGLRAVASTWLTRNTSRDICLFSCIC